MFAESLGKISFVERLKSERHAKRITKASSMLAAKASEMDLIEKKTKNGPFNRSFHFRNSSHSDTIRKTRTHLMRLRDLD